MGREVRRVPKGWEHPKYPADHHEVHLRGRYIAMHDTDFAQIDTEWNEGYAKFQEGFVLNYADNGGKWRKRTAEDGATYTLCAGERPSPDDYMPDWPEAECTMYMMYENVSEGTPISPAFETPEALARWLADTGASSFAGMKATYEQWLRVCNDGYAPSMVLDVGTGKMMSGVQAMSESG